MKTDIKSLDEEIDSIEKEIENKYKDLLSENNLDTKK
jgi:flagellar motility protein MotE (MotC chaperone)